MLGYLSKQYTGKKIFQIHQINAVIVNMKIERLFSIQSDFLTTESDFSLHIIFQKNENILLQYLK